MKDIYGFCYMQPNFNNNFSNRFSSTSWTCTPTDWIYQARSPSPSCLVYSIYLPNWSPNYIATSKLPSMMGDIGKIQMSSFHSVKIQKCLSSVYHDFMTRTFLFFKSPLHIPGNIWNFWKTSVTFILSPTLHKLIPLTRKFLMKFLFPPPAPPLGI